MRSRWSLASAVFFAGAVCGCDGDTTTGSDGRGGSGGASATTTSSNGGSGGAGGGGLAAGQCRDDADCPGASEYCVPPGTAAGCGICFTPETPCTSDDECTSAGAHYVCEVPPCSCDGTTKECRPGCQSEADCPAPQICGTDHRCAGLPCDPTSPCPANFVCSNLTSTCERRACTSDVECQGFCVLAQCYDELGTCELPAA